MKKLLIFGVCVVFLFSLALTTKAEEVTPEVSSDAGQGVRFGIKFSVDTITQADDINGGSYLYLNPVISFNEIFSINLRYEVDLAPEAFSDHLLSITPQFVIKNYSVGDDKDGDDQMYIGLTYLQSEDNCFYGLKFCPLANGRTTHPEDQMILEVLPISYLYNPDTSSHVLIIEIMSIGIIF